MGIRAIDDILDEHDIIVVLEAARVALEDASTFTGLAEYLDLSDEYLENLDCAINYILNNELPMND